MNSINSLKLVKSVLLIILFTLPLQTTPASEKANSLELPEWELVKQKHGIKVYTRLLPGQVLKSFKGETEINASFNEIYHLMQDVPAMTKWMHTVSSVATVEPGNARSSSVYATFKAPWPATDRDAVLVAQWHYDKNSDLLTFDVTNKEGVKPKEKGFVRIPYLKAKYEFAKTEEGKIKITYEADADPDGLLPKWIVNMVAVDTPFHTLKHLREMDISSYGEKEDFKTFLN